MSMEEKIQSTTPSSGSERHFKSRKVPVFVRVSITVFYYTALLNMYMYFTIPVLESSNIHVCTRALETSPMTRYSCIYN